MRIVAPVPTGAQFLRRTLERHIEHHIGEHRELVGKRHHRKLAFEVGDGEPQDVALLEVAQVVEEALDIGGERGAFRGKRCALGLPVGRGEARGGARERRGALQHLRILDQERVIRLAPVDRFHDREQPIDGRRVPTCLNGRRDDGGHELVEARANGRRKRAAAARARELDQAARRALAIADAGLAQVLGEAFRIGGGLRIVEPRRDTRRARVRGRRLEERVERLRDRRAMRLERVREHLVIGEIHRLGDRRLVFRHARQGLRLLVVVVLQAMLEAAQERVRVRERRGAPRVDEAARGERGERGARRGRAQRRVAAAAHELEELHAELDLADAARADLDVVGPAAPARSLEDAPVQLA